MPTVVNGGNTQQSESTQQNEYRSNVDSNKQDFTQQESAEPQIQVNQIVNQQVPIVVFVGPPSSGKSMILVRLAKYLRTHGFTVKTDETFLNTDKYREDCAEFNVKLNTNIALKGSVTYLLVSVYWKGKEIAKLLEAPGEHFYDPDSESGKVNNYRVEPYLAAIMASPNPKSYVLLLDLDSEISFRNDSSRRDAYTNRFLSDFYPNINGDRDRIILLYNMIDKTPFGTIHGPENESEARNDAKMYYSQLFATMRVQRWVFFTVDNFVFQTFCTGKFSVATDEHGNSYKIYNIADDVYPERLWQEIVNRW